ncbi:BatD family protein [Candidatus Rariloculus sp.]|uniref:BatD family protein n=1 Tax=Candidatus Rariloculus sp. TaxID=3101265 RepID=UPI003D107D25
MKARSRCLLVLLAVVALPELVSAQSLQLQVESRDIYAELPFTLSLSAQGFEEEPQPEPPELAIEGAAVTYLGVTPNVSSRIQIINGQRSERRDVTFMYRWRIETTAAGTYTVSPLTVSQGGLSASSRPASFTARDIATTNDMIVRMDLPDRPLWVGETFDVGIEWLLRRDVGEQEFVVPLFDNEYIQVESTATGRERTLAFRAGAGQVDLPITQDEMVDGGVPYTRFRFPARISVTRPGPIEIDPVMVAASLETGTRRDSFGFPVPAYELFKAEGERRRLVVRALPLEGRPPGFENAIGSGFSIDVQASRTVVQVGDPIDLSIEIRGDGPLEGLSLPALSGADGLLPQLFSVLDTATVGTIDADRNAKTFDVTVRVRSAEASEIPPLPFSYFDPEAGEYATAVSRPIALSVAGSSLIGAADVTVAPAAAETSVQSAASAPSATSGAGLASLTGADMSLSASGRTLSEVWVLDDLILALAVLYVLPLVVVAGRVWLVRTGGRRGRARELRQALRDVDGALASGAPAREAVPQVVNAMRALARIAHRKAAPQASVLERLETRAFDPSVADRPLDSKLAEEVRALAREWADEGTARAAAPTRGAVTFVIALAFIIGAAAFAQSAQTELDSSLALARDIYQTALGEDDRVRRTRLFAEAEQQLRGIAARRENAPEVLTDWGNAALGAQDLGRAVLAYRRALNVSPTHERARNNLAWLRDRAPVWFPRPVERGALDSLFFWHHSLAAAERHLIGAFAFAFGVLLLAPWSARRARVLRRAAVPLLIVWIGATGSAILAAGDSRDAVVLSDGTVLRSADSLGAPPTLGNPLPAGAELSILETREAWTRIALTDGTRGWVASSTIESVSR